MAALNTLTRRATLASACLLHVPGARAAPWPERRLRVIVPVPPGSGPDLVVRALAGPLQARLGVPIVPDNRPGAGGAIGTHAIAAATDGHTVGVSFGGPATTARLLDTALAYDPLTDLAPVALLATLPYLLVARAGLVRSVASLPDVARAAPAGLSVGSIGAGTVSHLLMAELGARHGFSVVHVPYRGYPQLLADLVPGRLDAAFVAAAHILPLRSDVRLAVLATTGAARWAALPEVPTLDEANPPYAPVEAWIALFAPAATPRAHVQRLAELSQAGLHEPAVLSALAGAGFTAAPAGPAALDRLRTAEAARWGALIHRLGLTAADQG